MNRLLGAWLALGGVAMVAAAFWFFLTTTQIVREREAAELRKAIAEHRKDKDGNLLTVREQKVWNGDWDLEISKDDNGVWWIECEAPVIPRTKLDGLERLCIAAEHSIPEDVVMLVQTQPRLEALACGDTVFVGNWSHYGLGEAMRQRAKK